MKIYNGRPDSMNDREGMVRLVVDNDLLACKWVGCHPCVNTSTVRLSLNDLLQKIIPSAGHPATFVNLRTKTTAIGLVDRV